MVHKYLAEAITELGIQDRTVAVSPVGCAVFLHWYLDCTYPGREAPSPFPQRGLGVVFLSHGGRDLFRSAALTGNLGSDPDQTRREPAMTWFRCPYLEGEVELTEERERHIAERHPDLLPEHRQRIAETLEEPEQIRRSVRFGSAKLFSRQYPDLQPGTHVVVVVVCGLDATQRNWIITAYITRNLARGDVEWIRN